ncbi:arsenate reductase [Pontibacter ummariensis]|uniref:Arsenate reductase n=1 Tax=Pontibacter ummariensis TaxID=1610492 RepID=A0A239FAF3_9BACT|nr:arsenate reductase (glutaredoxin) [Pontibacter ummariensis]PRY12347.1 arsenate reductase [Pontibacter ummariensis]SNS53879.1 arsenate reductase [Pontibacter ummariensis]
MLKIYHNNRCSKSRQTLELIQQAGQEVEVVEYLKTPPTAQELREVLQKLSLKPENLLRKGEKLYKENYKGKTLSDEEWIQVMVEHPVLMERPIVVKDQQAVVGRPPENFLTLLD